MQLEYTSGGRCLVKMEKYTREIIEGFPEHISGVVSTPAADHLFKVRDEHERSAYLKNKWWLFTAL
jgi:hypothetical protein